MLTSLAIATVEIDLSAMEVATTVAGFPPPLLVDQHGFSRAAGPTGFALGWLPDAVGQPHRLPLAEGDALLLFSDGLIDWSNELEVDPLALAYTLLSARERLGEFMFSPPDDLILVRFQTDPEMPMKEQFQPIIHESYAGSEVEDIDRLEAIWRRSLLFSLELELGERIFDLLICIREAVINALVHGCERSPSKVCTLHVSFHASERRVRVRVDDPGKGHDFNLEGRLASRPFASGRQLGLGMIQHLSDQLSFDNAGTSLVFDFVVSQSKDSHA